MAGSLFSLVATGYGRFFRSALHRHLRRLTEPWLQFLLAFDL